jgi:hypothetical protein
MLQRKPFFKKILNNLFASRRRMVSVFPHLVVALAADHNMAYL